MSSNLVSWICSKLRELFDTAVQHKLADGILLSGGLDTSVVTAIASKYTDLAAFTVALGNAPDVAYAKLIAKRFHLKHRIIHISEREAVKAAHGVIKIMKSFDPMEVRNDATILIGLRSARSAGIDEVMTGDAGDELFAGYSFLFKKNAEELDKYLKEMWKTMRFGSVDLAKSLAIEAYLPFLDENFKEFAMQISPAFKVREERGQLCGKWILRKAFENTLPAEIVWRAKMPIEQGSGTSILTQYLSSKISDNEFRARQERYCKSDGVQIRDQEHLFYYESYRRQFGIPRGSGEGTKICRACGANLSMERNFCRTCGGYPV